MKLRKRFVVPALAAAVLGGTALGLSGCGGSSDSTVTYEVTGTGPVQVSYMAMQGTTKLVTNQNENWNTPSTREFHVPKNDSNDYMLTAMQIPGHGPISCRILVDGKVVAEDHPASQGYLSSAVCSKLTPVSPAGY